MMGLYNKNLLRKVKPLGGPIFLFIMKEFSTVGPFFKKVNQYMCVSDGKC